MGLEIQRRYILGFDDGVDLPGRYTYNGARKKASTLVRLFPETYADVLIIDTKTGRAISWRFYTPPKYDPAADGSW